MTLIYCMKCKKKTETINEKKEVLKNGRNCIKGNCEKCDCKKCVFCK